MFQKSLLHQSPTTKRFQLLIITKVVVFMMSAFDSFFKLRSRGSKSKAILQAKYLNGDKKVSGSYKGNFDYASVGPFRFRCNYFIIIAQISKCTAFKPGLVSFTCNVIE